MIGINSGLNHLSKIVGKNESFKKFPSKMSKKWERLAGSIRPWKHLLRMAYVDCSLEDNIDYPCGTVLDKLPQSFVR